MTHVSTFLFVAAFLGGALNAVAGGGSFIALPALIFAGVSPVAANATATLALWPGAVSSIVAYRREIAVTGPRLAVLAGVSLVGGLLGAILLVRTSDTSFMRLLPWLMLAGAVTFTFGGRADAADTQRSDAASEHEGRSRLAILALMQFGIAVYGGYFGGGMGIMMLATLAIGGMTDIHGMNGLKSVLGTVINGVALAAFVVSGSVVWAPGLMMAGGGVLGGYSGASLARHVSRAHVRSFVIATAWTMTVYFFVR